MDISFLLIIWRFTHDIESGLEKFLRGLDDTKSVIEAGRSNYTMVDLFDDLGVEVAAAHPKDVKSIARAKIKTGKRDLQILGTLEILEIPENP